MTQTGQSGQAGQNGQNRQSMDHLTLVNDGVDSTDEFEESDPHRVSRRNMIVPSFNPRMATLPSQETHGHGVHE